MFDQARDGILRTMLEVIAHGVMTAWERLVEAGAGRHLREPH